MIQSTLNTFNQINSQHDSLQASHTKQPSFSSDNHMITNIFLLNKVEAVLGQVYPIFSIKIYIGNLHIFPITFGLRFAELNTIVLFSAAQTALYNFYNLVFF